MQSIEAGVSVKVFISYAHADQELRKKLEEHLSPLKRSGKIVIWQDQEIPAGANWEDQINTHLSEADLILLLVSSSFIASNYCWNKEVQAALIRHAAGMVRVIPILLRSALWEVTPLVQLQALPAEAKPVTEWENQDTAFHNVVRGIQKEVEGILKTLREETGQKEKVASPERPSQLTSSPLSKKRMWERRSDMSDHVTYCPRVNIFLDPFVGHELRTVSFLYDNLKWSQVGDYRILVNYHLPVRGTTVREIDLVVINKFGIFLLEVKSWLGNLDAYDDNWILRDIIKRDNPVESIQAKARMFHSQMFGSQGPMSDFRDVSVIGLVVLAEGLRHFRNFSSADAKIIVGLDQQLLHAISSTDLLFRGRHNRLLNNEDIEKIYEVIHGRHLAKRDEIIDYYLIVKKLREGDLYEAYEAQNVHIPTQRVRIKHYKLQRLSAPQDLLDHTVRHFRRSAEVVAALGCHPHILHTINFFPDANRPDSYYEITELVDGMRMDEMIDQLQVKQRTLSLKEQLDYLEPLCVALQHAHNYKENGKRKPIYHRNVNSETIFITRDNTVKLADFDFAKFGDAGYGLS